MKKYFALITILLVFLRVSYGKQIDEIEAKNAGLNFLHSYTSSSTLRSASGLTLIYKATSEADNLLESIKPVTYFYVYNASNGFVIVSGDDNVAPILGYSDENNFDPDNIPPNVTKWLEGYKSQIRYIIEMEIEATEEIKLEWNNYRNYSAA